MISIQEAAEKRITKLRMPIWAAKGDHIELHITPDGALGPWIKFHAEYPVDGMKNPQELIVLGFDTSKPQWEPLN